MKLKLFLFIAILSLGLLLGTPMAAQAAVSGPGRYLGAEIDRCTNSSTLTLWDARGWAVRFGGTGRGWVYVGGNRFGWWCGNSQEWTTAPFFTRWVYVVRGPNRLITWYTYQ